MDPQGGTKKIGGLVYGESPNWRRSRLLLARASSSRRRCPAAAGSKTLGHLNSFSLLHLNTIDKPAEFLRAIWRPMDTSIGAYLPFVNTRRRTDWTNSDPNLHNSMILQLVLRAQARGEDGDSHQSSN